MVVVTVNPLIKEEGEETSITEVVEVVEALMAKLLLVHHNSVLSISSTISFWLWWSKIRETNMSDMWKSWTYSY